jgi:hypothetical protein
VQNRNVEVDHQAHSLPGQLQVGQELGLVNAQHSFHSFQFYNDLIIYIYDQINSIFSAGLQSLVDDWQFYLSRERNILEVEVPHTYILHKLTQAVPAQVLMHLNGRP